MGAALLDCSLTHSPWKSSVPSTQAERKRRGLCSCFRGAGRPQAEVRRHPASGRASDAGGVGGLSRKLAGTPSSPEASQRGPRGLLAPGTKTLWEAPPDHYPLEGPIPLFSRGRAGRREEGGGGGCGEPGEPGKSTRGWAWRGGGRGPLAAALLLLLADKIGDGARDAAYQGPVLVKADAPIVVGVQVLDELVSSLPVTCILERKWGGGGGGGQRCGGRQPHTVPGPPWSGLGTPRGPGPGRW